jgi:hypothetical protein
MYRSDSQFYNLHSDEVDLEENEKIIQLNQKASRWRPSFVYTHPKKMLTKKKEKKKANPLEGRGKQSKEERNK